MDVDKTLQAPMDTPAMPHVEKCTACQWQCTEIRRCKTKHLPKGDINPDLLEGIDFKLPDSFEGI